MISQTPPPVLPQGAYTPDPKATVKDGLQTQHETMNGLLFHVRADESLDLAIDPNTGRPQDRASAPRAPRGCD